MTATQRGRHPANTHGRRIIGPVARPVAPPVVVRHPVPPVLKGVVTSLSYFESESPRQFEKILPLPRAHLIVNLSGAYRQLMRGAYATGYELRGPFFAGVQTSYLINENPRRLRMLVAEITADGVSALAAVPPRDLVDVVVPAEAILPGLDDAVTGSAVGAPPERLLDRLATFLAERCRPDRRDATVAAARVHLEAVPSPLVCDVAADLGLTPRALHGRFVRRCGMPPKRFADVARFAATIESLTERESVPRWADFVTEHGYYDQADGIHAFTRYAGLSPARFVDGLREHGLAFASFVPLEHMPTALPR